MIGPPGQAPNGYTSWHLCDTASSTERASKGRRSSRATTTTGIPAASTRPLVAGTTKNIEARSAAFAAEVTCPISGEWETEWGVSPEHIEEAIAMNPLKRFGKPQEIAETVLFLASDGAGYITGRVIHMDRGWVVIGWCVERSGRVDTGLWLVHCC
jgi:NAD(P)-dependent dehydrogenase (short-subunit alcohol dehydrogenase family)